MALYDGLLASAYDAYLARDNLDDLAFYSQELQKTTGPALELGCGTGRILLPLIAQGIDVEGLDNSADMLSHCRTKAAAKGLAPKLHQADMCNYALDRQYSTIFCAVGSFTLLAGNGEMDRALANARRHLKPLGQLLVSMDRPSSYKETDNRLLARDVLHPSGQSRLQCWLEPQTHDDPQIKVFRMTNQVVKGEGQIVQSESCTLYVRPMEPHDFEGLLRKAGYQNIEMTGPLGGILCDSDESYIARASAPVQG